MFCMSCLEADGARKNYRDINLSFPRIKYCVPLIQNLKSDFVGGKKCTVIT